MTLGYLSLQSSPVRVSNCTRPRSMRADMRKPSSLISWSHCGPDGAISTSWQSWGGIQRGSGDGASCRPRGCTGLDGLCGRTLYNTPLCSGTSREPPSTQSPACHLRPSGQRQPQSEGRDQCLNGARSRDRREGEKSDRCEAQRAVDHFAQRRLRSRLARPLTRLAKFWLGGAGRLVSVEGERTTRAR